MRTYATILCILLTVPTYAVDTLQVTTPDPMTEPWRWTTLDWGSGLVGGMRNICEDRDGRTLYPFRRLFIVFMV
jgi:hypothetical protein